MKKNTTPMPAHSKIGASSMYRWAACPGSVRMSENIPPTTTSYAAEGTKAHDLAEKMLRGQEINLNDYPADMREAVMHYTNYVGKISAEAGRDGQAFIEHRFELNDLHEGLFGTSDFSLYDRKTKILEVVDYKHGAGLPVEVTDNKQLKYYGLGALLTLDVPCKEIKLTVVQPRCPHPDGLIRSWTISAYALQEFAAELVEAAKRTEEPDAPLKSGEHCRFCPAAGVCPQLQSEAQSVAKKVFNDTVSYDPKELAHVLSHLPRIEAWVKSVREFAYNEALKGNEVPGFKLVEKRATRKWNDPLEAEYFAATSLNLKEDEIYKPREIKSVAQLEKFTDKAGKTMLKQFYSSISSGVTLVPDTDKRPPAKKLPQDVFEALPSGEEKES